MTRISYVFHIRSKTNYLMYIYSTAVGLRVKDGIVLAVEKLVQSKLLVPGANRRIQSADLHIGIVSYIFIIVISVIHIFL